MEIDEEFLRNPIHGLCENVSLNPTATLLAHAHTQNERVCVREMQSTKRMDDM